MSLPDIPAHVPHDAATCEHCRTRTVYVLQYQRGLSAHWIDSGTSGVYVQDCDGNVEPGNDLDKALESLGLVRSPAQQEIFRAEWRLVERVTTQRVLDR